MSTQDIINGWNEGVEPYNLFFCPNCKKYHDYCEGTKECIKSHKEQMKKKRIWKAYKRLYKTLVGVKKG